MLLGKVHSGACDDLDGCSKASVINNYEDNSWAFIVITCVCLLRL
jgi:hypothetical protein